MTDTNASRSWAEQRSRTFARERILTVLSTIQRPLRWAELADLLGGLTPEARMECEWLMDHGYITRWLPGQGLPQALRITIGTRVQMEEIADAIRAMCESAK